MSDNIYLTLANGFLAAHPHVAAEPELLVALLRLCTPRRMAAGEALCTEGEPGVELYFLLTGAIRVEKRGTDDEPVLLGHAQAPALLGQMAILDRTRRSASCIAETESLAVVMDQPRFSQLIRSTEPMGTTLRRLLLSSLTRQLVRGNAHLGSLNALAHGTGEVPTDTLSTEVELTRARGMLEVWSASDEITKDLHAERHAKD